MTTKTKRINRTKHVKEKCSACHGLGFIEKEVGLIMVKCEQCNGTGIKQSG